jgi:hypothetical protein
VIKGDLKDLSPEERVLYYSKVCESLSLNPYTKPFQYITLSGRLTLYATKDCTEQLRNLRNVSVSITAREHIEGVYVVTARATLPDGRSDESIGAVSLEGLKGEALANAYMKAETKSKRRVTLSICGLGMLDETEVETIPDARVEGFDDAPTVELISPDDLPFDDEPPPVKVTNAIMADGLAFAIKAGVGQNGYKAYIKETYDLDSPRQMTEDQGIAVLEHFQALAKPAKR